MPQSKTQTRKLNKKSKQLALCIQIHLISKDTQRLKTKGWRKTHQSNGEKKKGVVTFASDKIDFNSNKD